MILILNNSTDFKHFKTFLKHSKTVYRWILSQDASPPKALHRCVIAANISPAIAENQGTKE